MKLVLSPTVATEYGRRIRAIVPGARIITPSIAADGALAWSGAISGADVCCLSEDLWQDLQFRQLVLPAFFRIDGLRWFHTFSAGVDSPAFQTIIDRGAQLTNSSGASAPSIAQYVIAMMLYRAKRIDEWREQQKRHEWTQLSPNELTGQTVGIIGAGAIGGEVARLAKAFRMRTIGMRRSPKKTPYIDEQVTPRRLAHLLKHSDFVVLACPLTEETEGLIGERELRAMKPTATLINVARGRVVVEGALIRALQEDWIAGACLDVFTFEPLPGSSPLWDLPNVIITPHNSGPSPLNMERAMAIFLDNLERFAAGKRLRNLVTQAGVGRQRPTAGCYTHNAMAIQRPARKPKKAPKPRKMPPLIERRNMDIWEYLSELGKQIPEEELARMPVDGAANFDHYLDGSPKQY